MESDVEAALELLLEAKTPISAEGVKAMVTDPTSSRPSVFKGGHLNEDMSEMEMEDWQKVEIFKALVEADAREFASPGDLQGMNKKWGDCAASKRY